MEDPTFDRHGLTPVTVLNQAMSGLSHLHSLNIGKMNFFFEDCVNENEFQNRRKISLESKHDYHAICPWTFLVHYLQKIWDHFTFGPKKCRKIKPSEIFKIQNI